MIPGLDSSFDRPSPQAAARARAAGIGLWGGYLGSRDGLGLATRWSRQDFQAVQEAGLTAIGFCSGWDNATWIRETAAAWGILACVDVEPGIRVDGPWLRPWLLAAGAGLYGLASVHYQAGEPVGRDAAFNVVANYLPGGCTGQSWPGWLARPARCGWQCQGDHREFGLSVDRGCYDDSFQGGPQMLDPNDPIVQEIRAQLGNIADQGNRNLGLLSRGQQYDGAGNPIPGTPRWMADQLAGLQAQLANLQVPPASLQPVLDQLGALQVQLGRIEAGLRGA